MGGLSADASLLTETVGAEAARVASGGRLVFVRVVGWASLLVEPEDARVLAVPGLTPVVGVGAGALVIAVPPAPLVPLVPLVPLAPLAPRANRETGLLTIFSFAFSSRDTDKRRHGISFPEPKKGQTQE